MTIHWSACGSQIGAGNAFCSGCGLPLTAQAIAVPEPRKPILGYVVLAVGLFFVWCYAVDAYQQQHAAARYAAFVQQLHAGQIDAATFQERCGTARVIKQSPGGPTLYYSTGTLIDLAVTLPPHGAPRFSRQGVIENDSGGFDDYAAPADEDFALGILRCPR